MNRRGVDLNGPEAVALVGQGLAKRGEVGAAMGCEQAADIFDDDGPWRPTLAVQR
jgi:urease gamma subunit